MWNICSHFPFPKNKLPSCTKLLIPFFVVIINHLRLIYFQTNPGPDVRDFLDAINPFSKNILVPFGEIAFSKVYLLRFVLEEVGKAPGELLLFALLPIKVRPEKRIFFLVKHLNLLPVHHLFLFIYLFIIIIIIIIIIVIIIIIIIIIIIMCS